MATSDLLAELSKETFKPDSDGERKICKCVLKLLNDQSSDVQGLAVKCLSPLVRKVHEQQVEEIMVQLVTQVLTGKEEQRDICSIGLKTVVLEMPQAMAVTAVRQLAPKLVSGMAADVNMAPALVGDGAPSARPASHRARSAASATLRAQLPLSLIHI